MIYFIQCPDGGPVKIGYAEDVTKRVKDIQSCSPVPLALVATFDGDLKSEARWHKLFADQRLHGEWFAPTLEMAEAVEAGLRLEGAPALKGKPLKLIADLKIRKPERRLVAEEPSFEELAEKARFFYSLEGREHRARADKRRAYNLARKEKSRQRAQLESRSSVGG